MANQSIEKKIKLEFESNIKEAQKILDNYTHSMNSHQKKWRDSHKEWIRSQTEDYKKEIQKRKDAYELFQKDVDEISKKYSKQRDNEKWFSSGFIRPSEYIKRFSLLTNNKFDETKGQLYKDADTYEKLGQTNSAAITREKATNVAVAQKSFNIAMQVATNAALIVTAGFKRLNTELKSVVKSMTSFENGIITYSTSTSLRTNSNARETQLKYGLSASQAYAFDTAKSLLNIKDEDLMYMNSAQREKLLAYMEKYSAWYEQMEQSGVLNDIQEMQLEFEEFKQEFAMEFLNWVADNKDVILNILRASLEAVKFLADVVLKIADAMTMGSRIVNMTVSNNNTYSGTTGASGIIQENWNQIAKGIAAAIE